MKWKSRFRKRGCRKWLTFAEIEMRYGSKDIATAICNSKEADPELSKSQVRFHPDCSESSFAIVRLCSIDRLQTSNRNNIASWYIHLCTYYGFSSSGPEAVSGVDRGCRRRSTRWSSWKAFWSLRRWEAVSRQITIPKPEVQIPLKEATWQKKQQEQKAAEETQDERKKTREQRQWFAVWQQQLLFGFQ